MSYRDINNNTVYDIKRKLDYFITYGGSSDTFIKSHKIVSLITGCRCSSRGRGWLWPPTRTTTERPTNSTSVIIFIIFLTKNTVAQQKFVSDILLYRTVILVLINDKLDLFVCRIPPGPSSLPGLQDWNQVLRVAQWVAAILHMAPHVHSEFCAC